MKRYGRKNRDVPTKGGISKPVEAEVFSCCDEKRREQLEREIEAVEWAMGTLKRIAETGETLGARDIARNAVQLAEMVYIKRSHGVVGASVALHFSERTARRYHQMFLKLVAARLGLLEQK